MPTRTTDRITLRRPIIAQLCRTVENGLCAPIGKLLLTPGAAAAYTDRLPPDLTQRQGRLMSYEVLLQNHAGKAAGPSNRAYSAAGSSPPQIAGLTAKVRQDGVLLSWQVEPGPTTWLKIDRRRVTSPAPQVARSALAPAAPPADQTLAVHPRNGADPGYALDDSALFNQQYSYRVERVESLALEGQTVEVQGPPGAALMVTTTDTFPPAVPQGLVAVADAAAGAIDLSWSPDSDRDLNAYHVYRRDLHPGATAQPIAVVSTQTSFRDTATQPGHAYAYSLTAVDQSGNESKPSAEVEETLPAR